MGTVTTKTAPQAGWADVEHTMTGGGDGASCWCQWFLVTNAEFSRTTSDDKRGALRAEIEAGTTHGVVAYVDGEAAGWCRIAPRPVQKRLMRGRLVTSSPAVPLDDTTVWSLSCLVVRKEHRGQGLTGELIRAAVQLAAAQGARLIEAYPKDPAPGRSTRSNELYVGTRAMFESAGFAVSAEPKPGRLIMELALT